MNKSNVTRLALAIVLLSFLMSTFVSLWSLHLMGERSRRELSLMMAARIYDTIVGELSEPVVVSQTMAHDSFLIELLENEDALGMDEAVDRMQAYLAGIKDGLGYEAAFVVSDASGRYYSFRGFNKIVRPGEDERDRWYADFLLENRPYDLDVDNDELSQDAWTVFVDSRIEDASGKLLGVCGVGVHMTKSQTLFLELEKEYSAKISLVDAGGLVQVDTDESRIETERVSGVPLSPAGDYQYRKTGGGHLVSRFVDKLGWYLVVEIDSGSLQNEFLNVILLNVGLCVLVMGLLTLAVRIIAVRTAALAHASFRDQATGLFNRRAFEEEKARLHASVLPEDFVFLSADINGLKTANDTLGHVAGDELIRGASEALNDAFGPYGKLFRIGGDEFAGMLRMPEDKLETACRNLDELMHAWCGELVKELSISYGCASSREFPSETITELGVISDERMYKAKEAYYRTSGRDRRKH